ncbi:MAG TPA: hypothetical protein VMH78_08435 [Thermoplasmata archaeon]|nr:hypothetical protein [Thermoplasmata archaeon]
MPAQPAARPIPWGMLSMLSRFLGFALLFVGTLLAIIGLSYGGSCYSSTGSPVCIGNTSWESGAANAILAAKLLWSIGLFLFGVGIGIKMHWTLQMPASGKAEEVTYVVAERRANYWLLILTIVLLAILLWTVNGWPSPPPGV